MCNKSKELKQLEIDIRKADLNIRKADLREKQLKNELLEIEIAAKNKKIN